MSQVNLFRIQRGREDSCISFIEGQYEFVAESKKDDFIFKLFYQETTEKQDINWGWAFSLFGETIRQIKKMPKGIILVQRSDKTEQTYAISFGGAHFNVDSYCDREFGFDFACRVKIKHTKLTSTINSNSKRNKTISSYKDFDHLEINSGESYTKLKIEIDLENNSDIANSVIEVGSSLKISLREDSFDNIIKLIKYIEEILTKEKLTRIPVCNIVKKQEEIDILEKRLKEDFLKNNSTVIISEFDVIGVDEVFIRADSFMLLCDGKSKSVNSLDISELRKFYIENNIDDTDTIFKTRIQFLLNGNNLVTKPIRNFIDYLDEEDNALLVCGKWYRYNIDFCQCLKDSLEDIRVVYDSKFDLSNKQI